MPRDIPIKLPIKGLNFLLTALIFFFIFLPVVTLFMSIGGLIGSLVGLAIGSSGLIAGTAIGGIIGILIFAKVMKGINSFNRKFIQSLEHIEAEMNKNEKEHKDVDPSLSEVPLNSDVRPGIIIDIVPEPNLFSSQLSSNKSKPPKTQ